MNNTVLIPLYTSRTSNSQLVSFLLELDGYLVTETDSTTEILEVGPYEKAHYEPSNFLPIVREITDKTLGSFELIEPLIGVDGITYATLIKLALRDAQGIETFEYFTFETPLGYPLEDVRFTRWIDRQLYEGTPWYGPNFYPGFIHLPDFVE